MTTKFIAEIGNNHNGDIALARRMAEAAIDAGADTVKFQIYDVSRFIAPANPYYDEFKAEALDFAAFAELKSFIEERGARFLATPFDRSSLDYLAGLGMDTVKISSSDSTNFDLLQGVADHRMRLILSLGGSSYDEIDETVAFLRERKVETTLLHCTLAYPAPVEIQNLALIPALRQRYGMPVGFSDHTEGIEAALAAVALGAAVVEKHFTTDRSLPGGDNEMSILPDELERLCREGRSIASAIGDGERRLDDVERRILLLVRRTFHATRDIPAGDTLRDEDLILLRPADADGGFHASERQSLEGRRTSRAIAEGSMITGDGLE